LITDIVAWPRERLEQLSTRIVFFIAGFVMAAWAPLVPFAKARAAIDDGVLGLILLCLGVGSIVTMPLSGALAARFGCRLVIAASTVLLCLTLPLLATVATLPLLVAVVLVFGAGVGALDVAINIQAIIVERASGRPMMSGFHGQFSLGGIAGAAGVTALLGAGSSRPLPCWRWQCCISCRTARDARGQHSPFRTASFCSSASCASSHS
jgi:MFS family permease